MSALYSSTKFAINGLMQALAHDLRLEGHMDSVKLTTVFPYFVNTRLDLMNAIKLRYFVHNFYMAAVVLLCPLYVCRFPPLDPDLLGKEIVDGILKNQTEIFLPKYVPILLSWFKAFSEKNQHLIRDHVLKESRSLDGN